jgi:hypothetical protein
MRSGGGSRWDCVGPEGLVRAQMGLCGLGSIVSRITGGGGDDDVTGSWDGGSAASLLQQGGRSFTGLLGSARPDGAWCAPAAMSGQ